MNARSGDLCSFGKKPTPAYFVTHYRCNDYADGTVTDARNGRIVTHAKPGALRGFYRATDTSTSTSTINPNGDSK